MGAGSTKIGLRHDQAYPRSEQERLITDSGLIVGQRQELARVRAPLPATADDRSDSSERQVCDDLFVQQAERRADAVAVVFQGERLTYRELNRRAYQLAHHLQCLGVGPEVLWELASTDRLRMIIGMLAILKAGGAYVPFDPGYPRERFALMLEDAKIRGALDAKRLGATSTARWSPVVDLNRDREAISREMESNPRSAVTGDNLAYAIFTSGSTGRPKGVQITHRSLVNLFGVTRSSLGLTESDIWTVVHSFAFDFSVWEIWGALLTAAVLCWCRPN